MIMPCNSCTLHIIKKNAVYTDVNPPWPLQAAAYSTEQISLYLFIHTHPIIKLAHHTHTKTSAFVGDFYHWAALLFSWPCGLAGDLEGGLIVKTIPVFVKWVRVQAWCRPKTSPPNLHKCQLSWRKDRGREEHLQLNMRRPSRYFTCEKRNEEQSKEFKRWTDIFHPAVHFQLCQGLFSLFYDFALQIFCPFLLFELISGFTSCAISVSINCTRCVAKIKWVELLWCCFHSHKSQPKNILHCNSTLLRSSPPRKMIVNDCHSGPAEWHLQRWFSSSYIR